MLSGENQDLRSKGISGLALIGCLMLSFAIGFLIGNIVVGLFGGLGICIIAMAIVRYGTDEW